MARWVEMRLFALAFVVGALVLQQCAELPPVPILPAAFAALLSLALIAPCRRGPRAAVLLVAGALAGFGLAAWRAESLLAQSLPRSWEGLDVELEGVVASLPQLAEGGTRFLFDVETARTPGSIVPATIALTWYAERGKQGDAAPPRIASGQRWRFVARLKRPRGLANPHGFDFEPWALERGIRATGYVRAKAGAALLAPRVDGWPYTLHRWRGEIRDAMLAHLGEARLRGVLVALAIGDQDSIAPDDWEVFWRTGVGHLMSISGLHITMLAGLAFAAAYFLWVRMPALALRVPARKAAVVVGAGAALAYSLMTGYQVPAQRTFVMLAVVAACLLADRHGSSSRVLALAALAVVALDPWAVLSPGFWLSFGAVASIFYVMALRTGQASRLEGAVLEQLAVTVGMLPTLVALFQEVSIVSPIANAFAIPLVSLAVVPLAIAGAFLPLPFLMDAAHGLMLGVMVPLEWLAALPSAMLESHAPAAWTVIAAVFGCAWLLAPRGVPLRSAGLAWMAPMFAVLPPSPGPGEAWLDVLDVGNGLAAVVRTSHHALVYDTGPSWSAEADSGGRIVIPFLRGEGIAKLDGVVVSHADDDHSGGAASIAYARAPGWLLSPLAPEDPLHAAFPRSTRCEAGQQWRWDGVEFRVLHPAAAIYGESRKRKENDRGCVVRVATAGHSVLLAADVEARSEAEMIARDRDALASEVLLVPHHGSRTSSTPEFIDAVSPRVGLLSVGYRNRFHHPNPTVVARYASRGIELRRTDQEGALHVAIPSASPAAVAVEGQARQARYWSERRAPP
ncbi:MAG: DNA internalization-related competence protein ComEC/Rec2 [Usitatibacter sp.]